MNEQSAAEILRVANDMSEAFRSTVTEAERAALDARHAAELDGAAYAGTTSQIDFTLDALQTLAGDMRSVIEQRAERLYRQALEVYYAAEELARDPEHAHLIEQVETMRLAHERDYGYPPPARR